MMLTAITNVATHAQYIKAQTDAHDEAIALFSSYAQYGSDPELRAFAEKTLPSLKAHKQHVEQIKSSM